MLPKENAEAPPTDERDEQARPWTCDVVRWPDPSPLEEWWQATMDI